LSAAALRSHPLLLLLLEWGHHGPDLQAHWLPLLLLQAQQNLHHHQQQQQQQQGVSPVLLSCFAY
jgi:hypothetical protein